MTILAMLRLGFRQTLASKGVFALLALGVFVAATLLASAPIYARAMADLGLTYTVREELQARASTQVLLDNVPLATGAGQLLRSAIEQRIDERIGWFRASQSRSVTLGRFSIAQPGDPPKTGLFQGQPQSLTGYEAHVRVVSGQLPAATGPGEPLQLALGSQAAQVSKLKPGDVVELRENFDTCERILPTTEPPPPPPPCDPTATVSFAIPAVIAGIVDPVDPNDSFWIKPSGSYFAPFRLDIPDVGPVLPMFTDERSLLAGFGASYPDYRASFAWRVDAQPSALDRNNFQLARGDIAGLSADAEQLGGWAYSPLGDTLAHYGVSSNYQETPLTLLLLEITGIALFYVGLVSTIVVERQAPQIALFRARGASLLQIGAMYLGQGLALGVPAVVLAPFIAAATTALLGMTPVFADVSNGDLLPVHIPAFAFATAAIGAGLSILALLVPALVVGRRNAAAQRRTEARPGVSFFQRYYLDFAFVAMAALALWEVRQRSSVFEPSSTGGLGSDPLLLASPALIIAAGSALVLRFYPLVLRIAARLALPAAGLSLALGLVQVVRNSSQYTRLTLLLLMAVAVGAFAASYASTTNRSYSDRAGYDVGSDLRVAAPASRPLSEQGTNLDGSLSSIGGVQRATTVIRTIGGVAAIGGTNQPFQVLGVDPAGANATFWWRGDFANRSLASLLDALAAPSVAPGQQLDGDIRSFSFWVKGDPALKPMNLWVRYRDGSGHYGILDAGSADSGGAWTQRTVSLAGRNVTAPLSVVAIAVTMPQNMSANTYPALLIDDITATRADGATVTVDDFESGLRWATLPILARQQDAAAIVTAGAHSGQQALRLTFAPGVVNDVRGIYTSAQPLPLDAVASDAFLAATGLRVGMTAMLLLGNGSLTPVTIAGSYHLFPTLPSANGPSIIFNRDQLETWGETVAFGDGTDLVPNEALLALKPGADSTAVETALSSQLNEAGFGAPQVMSRLQQLDANRRNPLIAAGGSGILFVAFVAILVLVAAALLLALLTSVARRRVEFGVVRALGVSRTQVLRMLALEYATVAVVGTGIGAVLGVVVGRQMLGFLNVTETGAKIEPGFILQTRWDVVGAGVAVLLLLFATGLAVAMRLIAHEGADVLRTE